jgi:hypothetical protein
VWLTVELVAALYVVSFVWFWTLCRSSARRARSFSSVQQSPSNLIPFERGQQLRKRPASIPKAISGTI